MSHRRAVYRLIVGVLPALIVFAGVVAWRWQVAQDGRRQLNAAVARVDAAESRWRWEDIEADQPDYPEDRNAARLVARFRAATIAIPYIQSNLPPDECPGDAAREEIENAPNRLLALADDQLIDRALDGAESGWHAIESLADCPQGRMRLLPAATWRERTFAPEEHPRVLQDYLEWECERLARGPGSDRQQTIVHAFLNLTRIDRHGPLDGDYRSRLFGLHRTVRLVERQLALDRAGPGLARLQTELTLEADRDLIRPGLREIRADHERALRALDSGEIPLSAYMGPDHRDIFTNIRVWRARPYLRADWAHCLDVVTWVLAVADLPEPARLAALLTIPAPPQNDLFLFCRGSMLVATMHVKQAMATTALLRCAVAGLAVERHRLATGAWPGSLEAIPTSILPAIPSDPYTGKPLRLASRTDRWTVYSVGPDGTDDGGVVHSGFGSFRKGAIDIGFRLYHPDQRRRPHPNAAGTGQAGDDP